MAQKKAKGNFQRHAGAVLVVVVSVAIGFAVGYLAFGRLPERESLGERLLFFGGFLVVLYLAVLVQTIVHEGGHLLFGLWSGYRFASFRVMSWMWVKEGESIRLRRLSVVGTGGQCLMVPPDLDGEGDLPVVRYNLGGVVMNVLVSLLCLGLYLAGPGEGIFAGILLILLGVGFLTAVVNGIPLHLEAVDNDGYNAWSLHRNPEARRAFWLQMQLNQKLAQGQRLKDLPEEWFEVPSDEAMANGLVAALGVFACNRLVDAQRLEEADRLMEHLLSMDSGMVGLHRRLLICDRIYCALLRGEREAAEELYSPGQKKFMKDMKTFPSVIRTEYALALAAEDVKRLETARKRFEKCAKGYPYASEIQSERELMALAEARVQVEETVE